MTFSDGKWFSIQTAVVWGIVVGAGCIPPQQLGLLSEINEELALLNDQAAGLTADPELAGRELAACDDALAIYNEEVADLEAAIRDPLTIAVRIENHTDIEASVSFASRPGVPETPLYPDCGYYFYGGPPFNPVLDNLLYVEPRQETVIVKPGGTAAGMVPCGTVIGIAVTAPSDSYGFGSPSAGFDLYLGNGNLNITGIGVSGEGEFSGDIVGTLRFVRPAVDGLDCTAHTLVVRILTASTPPAYDFESGETISAGETGTAELLVE